MKLCVSLLYVQQILDADAKGAVLIVAGLIADYHAGQQGLGDVGPAQS